MPDETASPFWWRTGRKVGRTLYAQQGDTPHDSDPLIGVMDTPELAAKVAAAVNAAALTARPSSGANTMADPVPVDRDQRDELAGSDQ